MRPRTAEMTAPNVDACLASERDCVGGVLLGTAVGDALGLPREGLSARRAQRLFGDSLRHAFLAGRGMCSDDTEHTIFAAQAWLEANGNEARFADALASRLRWWLVSIPAGVGFATLRAVGKLWLGYSPENSGVCSAGNGPAMRAPILGVCESRNVAALKRLVRVSTRMTHTDPKAEQGALAIALAARRSVLDGPTLSRSELLKELDVELSDETLKALLKKVSRALDDERTPAEFAKECGWERGVSGYMYHTVPAALFCWLRSLDSFETAVTEIVNLGGDADSTGAIVGGLAGATLGKEKIPREWIYGIAEWPRSVAWMEALAAKVQQRQQQKPVDMCDDGMFWGLKVLMRNICFAVIVLGHGVRRLLPPY